MKVILVEDVKKLGKKGEIIEVKDGQARNYLIPNNLAIEANKKNINALNAKNESIKRSESQNQELALKLAKQLEKELIFLLTPILIFLKLDHLRLWICIVNMVDVILLEL